MREKLLVKPEVLDARWVRRTFVLGVSTLALLLAGVFGFVDGVALDAAQAVLLLYLAVLLFSTQLLLALAYLVATKNSRRKSTWLARSPDPVLPPPALPDAPGGAAAAAAAAVSDVVQLSSPPMLRSLSADGLILATSSAGSSSTSSGK